MPATHILAATLTIAFEGLMLFQGPSATEKKHVALVNAPYHHPYVEIIGDGARIPLNKNDVITFGPNPGVAHTSSWFDRYVVTLREHAIGSVAQKVVANDVTHDGTLAAVTLPNGDLTILFMMPYAVELRAFTLSSTHCFPRYVVLKTYDNIDTVWINGQPHDIPEGIVVISNGGEQHPDTHFHEYRRMLDEFGIAETATLLNDYPCYVYTTPDGIDPDVVEKLKNRINAIPNGDCGPVDNP